MLIEARLCAVLSSLLLLPACASLPSAADACDPPPSAAIAIESGRTEIIDSGGCRSSLVPSRLQTVGRVEQRGSQTRTVGVPRGFLIAMIVLIVIFGLA